MTVHDRHCVLLDAVNDAQTTREHEIAEARLRGFRDGVALARGFDGADCGAMLADADNYYLSQGIDRPMCGGVFLDWRPASPDYGPAPLGWMLIGEWHKVAALPDGQVNNLCGGDSLPWESMSELQALVQTSATIPDDGAVCANCVAGRSGAKEAA